MSKITEIEKEIQEYKDLISDKSVPQDEKDFAQGEIAELEAELAKLKAKDEPKKKVEAKKEEPKKASAKPKRKADEKDEVDCEDLASREEKAKKSGYDIDELLKKAKESKAKAKARALAKKDEPKKTPATKNKEAVEKTATRVLANIEKRAETGSVSAIEVEKLIAEHEGVIKKLRKLLDKLKSAKKLRKGGKVGDENYSADPKGSRKSMGMSKVRMQGGVSYKRKNANQFFNDERVGKTVIDQHGNKHKVRPQSEIGGRDYTENRENRADKRTWK